ncbi:Rab5 GDP/GTP exchange factor [Operophtera brumata]|uniref:Rab5 GDP/GTP exchange factor n=1 Tax=Operophtera brumata TaxID=104452 RepID=A0A0L7LES6_OPEBR|nr:Rab5 GDP/GTP exchange factor [Operophtera brumata]
MVGDKSSDVLTKTPLEIKPRRELPRIGKLKGISTAPLIDLEASAETPTSLSNQETSPTSLSNQETQPTLDTKPEETAQNPPTVIAQPQNIPEIPIHIRKVSIPQETEQKLNILGFETIRIPRPLRAFYRRRYSRENLLRRSVISDWIQVIPKFWLVLS